MGYRIIKAKAEDSATPSEIGNYDLRRLTLGLPDGSRDFDVDKTLVLEGNLEELHGVDFEKGCYVGQEVTARMKYRASLKKRLLPITVDGPLPDRGTEITNDQGQKIGDFRSGRHDRAIGYFRLARMEFNKTYHCGESKVTPQRPDWLKEDNNG
jgi:folate-binding protein YgfZ